MGRIRGVGEAASDVSIVVPTRDRPDALARCLAALTAQDSQPGEVVVVDDGSEAAGAVADAVAACPVARLVRAEGRGPAAARNLGARQAEGEVVLFTDDDCAPRPGWAASLAGAAREGPAAGPTVNVAFGAAPAAAQAITNHLTRSSLATDGASVGFAPTSNLGAPAELVARIPFDEAYPLAAGEDRDWCSRVRAAGERIAWVPGAVVDHHHPMGSGAFLGQQLRYGRGAARFHAGGEVPNEHRRRPGLYAGFIRSGLRSGVAAGALVAAAQVATGVGFALERARPRE